jgi:uncharacterized protein (TIGR03382 family)
VQVTALDAAGNASHCQFRITVHRTSGTDAGTGTPDAGTPSPRPPIITGGNDSTSGCGCQSGGGAAANAVLLAWGLVALRVRRRGHSRRAG